MKTPNSSVLASVLLATALLPAQRPQERADALSIADIARSYGACRDADGTVRAESARYHAAFTADAATLSTYGPAAEQPTLTVRLATTGRAGAFTAVERSVEPTLAGDRVRYEHAGVVEAYRIDATAVEQSFEFAAPPPGTGDLLLTVQVGGNVAGEPRAPAHQPLEFTFAGAPAFRYGEAIAFDRHGHRVDVLTAYDGQGRIELTVPQHFVDAASWPIVVDPAIGPVFLPSGSANNDSDPDVAYDIDNQRYFVVWQRSFSPTSTGIRGAIFDPDGNPITGTLFFDTGTDLVAPSVAFCRAFGIDAFLLVWQQPTGIQGLLARSDDGAALGSSFAISSPLAGEVDRRPAVSGPGDGAMMVAWDRTASGQTNPNRILMRDLYWPNPAQPNTINFGPERTLDTFGGTTSYVQNVQLSRSDVRTTVGGQTWYANRAVWERFYATPAPGDFDLYTCSFRVKPSPFEFAFIQPANGVSGATSVGPNEITPDIGSRATLHQNGGDIQYLIAWERDGDVLGQMYDLSTAMGTTIGVAQTTDYEGVPAVGAGFCEFTVGYMRAIPPAEFDIDVLAARVLLDGTVAVSGRLIDDPGSQFQNGLRASSRPIHTASEKQTNRSLLVWMGQTGPSGGNDVRGRFFEPVGANVYPFGTACAGPFGTLAAIGTYGGLPFAGNDGFGFTVSGTVPSSLAVLVVSDQFVSAPIPGAPGCTLYAGLPFLVILPTVTDASGFGSVPVPIPCGIPSPSSLAFQWGIFVPGFNPFGWVVSNDDDVLWSHN